MAAGFPVCDPRLNPMGSQLSIPILWNLRSESVGACNFEFLVEESDTGSPGLITVTMEYLLAFQFHYCKLCVENRWERYRKHYFVNFCSLVVLWSSVSDGSWRGRRSFLESAERASFSNWGFSQSNKHDIFWHVISTGYFYVLFLWTIAVSDYQALANHKSLGLALSAISFTVKRQQFSLNIFIFF